MEAVEAMKAMVAVEEVKLMEAAGLPPCLAGRYNCTQSMPNAREPTEPIAHATVHALHEGSPPVPDHHAYNRRVTVM